MTFTISRTIEVTARTNVGRNDPCPCGSGKKYKKCCLPKEEAYPTVTKTGRITRIVNFLTKQQFFRKLIDARKSELFGDRPLEEAELTALMEAVIFDDLYEDKTPFDYFIVHADLSDADRSLYASWKTNTLFSFFQIQSIRIGKSMTVIDLRTDIEYLVYEHTGTYQAEPGMILAVRIVPCGDHYMFTGGTMLSFPKEAAYSLKRIGNTLEWEGFSEMEFIRAHYGKKQTLDSPLYEETQTIGPIEKALTHRVMTECQHTLMSAAFDALSQHKKQQKIDAFTNRWFDTPQKELSNRTPKEAILIERKELGNPQTEVSYTLSITPLDTTPETSQSILYGKAVDTMMKHQYLEALRMFASLANSVHALPEPFRWWGNVGACLANLGEVELAHQYFERSLALNPQYDVAQRNSQTYQDPMLRISMGKRGRIRLFESIMKEGIFCEYPGIETNELLHDAYACLTYIHSVKPLLTKTFRDIPRTHVLAITNLFIHPDPAEVEIRAGKKSIVTVYREESHFPKVHCIRAVLGIARLIKDDGKRLVLTKKGRAFLGHKEAVRQFGEIMAAWLVRLDWKYFEDNITSLGGGMIAEQVQEMIYPLFMQMKTYGTHSWSIDDCLHGLIPETDEQMARFILQLFLEKHFFLNLTWAGILEYKTLATALTFRLTPFGQCFLETIESSMKNAIPPHLTSCVDSSTI